ncbi:MAG: C4-type zinc ribbon domain-containing protein [Terriglobia bacterium]
MNIELQSVIRLQELDKQISTLQEWIAALPHHLREIEKQLSDITAAHAAVKQHMAANQQQRRKLDGDIQTLEQKISKYNNQLLEVKTNEEYRAFLTEIEFNKNAIRKIEDGILDLMVAAEADEKELKETEAESRRQQQDVAREKQQAETDTRGKQQELDSLLATRDQVTQSLSDAVLDLYTRTAKLRNGVVVAEVRDQICTVCHVMLRPQTFNEVMRNKGIIQCDNCSRILFWVPPAEPAAPPSAFSGEPVRE